jgi:uncharacterized membrane-anchored protein
MSKRKAIGVVFAILTLSVLAAAQTLPEEFEAKLGYQTGKIVLPNGIASIQLPDSFRFIGPEGSRRLLVQAWGNPDASAEGVLGMLIPSDVSPVTDEGWGIVITYEEDGYVDDSDAAKINYDKLLAQMQEGTAATNEERKKAGFEPITLVGWAEPPHYDASEHKLYWAKELAFGKSDEHTLNYSIRILGRRGVLVLNAVAGMNQLEAVREPAKTLLSAVDFSEGLRYRDYISGDKVASYGVTALIAGGAGAVAVKAGLFKKFWKLIVLGVAALGGALKKIFGSRTRAQENPTA